MSAYSRRWTVHLAASLTAVLLLWTSVSSVAIVDSSNVGNASYTVPAANDNPFNSIQYVLSFGASDLLSPSEGFDIEFFDTSSTLIGMDTFTNATVADVAGRSSIIPTIGGLISDTMGSVLITALLSSSFDATTIRLRVVNTALGNFTGALATFNVTTTPVSAVPLPAALPLFLSALAGLGFMRWRSKGAAA